MFPRPTSTPLMYITKPSSYHAVPETETIEETSVPAGTVNVLRK